jgi:hypothetical protein
MLPLLACYPNPDRAAALHQLLLHLVISAAGSSSSTSGSGSSSSGIKLAVAVLEREAELLQMAADVHAGAGRGAVAAIAKSQAAATTPTAAAAGRQQTSPPVSPLADTEQQQQQQGLPDGGLLWGGDVEACVTAVLAAVSACSSTNQWAKLEQLLDAAAEALAAAAAAAGQPLPASIASISQRQQQQQGVARRMSVRSKGRSTAAAAGSSNGWDDSWSDNDGDNSDDDHSDADVGSHNEQLTAAAVRAALAQHALSEAAVHVLAADLASLRGRVRAARLLTKQGCCVGLGELAAADGAAVNDMLQRLLGRAQRYGSAVATSRA